MSNLETIFDFSECTVGLADAVTLLAEAAQTLSEAARAMGVILQPDTHALHNIEKGVPEEESGDDDRLSTGQSSTAEDPNTGNNILREGSFIGTSNTPSLYVIPRTAAASQNQRGKPSRPPIVTDQDEFRDSVVSPGRYYIVIEEEFDILPLIVAYASICRKVLCCMPFIEASQSWRVLLSAFLPNHEVLEVSSQISSLSPSAARYMSSNEPSLLIQSFTSWQTHQTVSSISDTFLVWGFLNIGEEQLSRIQDTMLNTRHVCAIVTSQEYLRSNFKAYLSSLEFTKHPTSNLIKRMHSKSLLASFRKTIQKVLGKAAFQENIHTLYRECLAFYIFPPSKDVWWSVARATELANKFSARTLLHGRKEDGSSIFKPDGQMLSLDREFIDRLGLSRSVQLGLINEDTNEQPLPIPSAYEPMASSEFDMPKNHTDQVEVEPYHIHRSNFPTPNLAALWYIALREDFDMIPFILHQVELNPKVICLVSYGTNSMVYQSLFKRMVDQKIICPGKKASSIDKAMSTFNTLQSGLLLLRGAKATSVSLDTVDTVIYWGTPPEPFFSNHLKVLKATNSYVVISGNDDSKIKQRLINQNGAREYPGLVRLDSTGPESLLRSYRVRTQQTLEGLPITIANKIYRSHVGTRLLGKETRESVIWANRFAARVLLHGHPEDGSMLYPPIRPKLSVKQKVAAKIKLQPYVAEGLIWVE